jgi:hypothetical protein
MIDNLDTHKIRQVITRDKKQYLFGFEQKLFGPDGEGDVRHGFKFSTVHG